MAEWIGHLIADWPTILVGLVCGVILIVAGIFIWFWTAADPYPFGERINLSRKKKHGKK